MDRAAHGRTGADLRGTDAERHPGDRRPSRAGLPAVHGSRDRIARLFAGPEPVEPGVVPPHRRRPGEPEDALPADADVLLYAGVARKP
ncbi:SAM-dependent methyltransferase [Streptomyces desertarenae]|uniref:SAM-dependent methyltransferase n=1 Tax=Streptomyces desertarenae TaxID=2666184 RepID=A0ABW4PM92_9ACTN